MAPTRKQRGMGSVRCLDDLVEHLKRSGKSTAQIFIPARTNEGLFKYLATLKQTRQRLVSASVPRLVSALEGNGRSLCGQLSTPAFVMVYTILSMSENPPAAERGLYLLAASICNGHVALSGAAQSSCISWIGQDLRCIYEVRCVGKEFLESLLDQFCTAASTDSMRIWSGLLLLVLFRSTEDVKTTGRPGYENLHQLFTCKEDLDEFIGKLRTVFTDQSDMSVKILAASIGVVAMHFGPNLLPDLVLDDFRLVCCADDFLELSDPGFAGLQKFIFELESDPRFCANNAGASFLIETISSDPAGISLTHQNSPIFFCWFESKLAILRLGTRYSPPIFLEVLISKLARVGLEHHQAGQRRASRGLTLNLVGEDHLECVFNGKPRIFSSLKIVPLCSKDALQFFTQFHEQPSPGDSRKVKTEEETDCPLEQISSETCDEADLFDSEDENVMEWESIGKCSHDELDSRLGSSAGRSIRDLRRGTDLGHHPNKEPKTLVRGQRIGRGQNPWLQSLG